jgi:hypothetical protein
MPCVNECRIPICKSCIFSVGPILPISSQRKYGMGLIFGACEIPLCVHCPIFSAVSFQRSSLAPAGQAPPMAGSTIHGFFVCIYQQGFVSFCIMLLSVILDLGGYFTSFQCRPSYYPVASSNCAFRTDLSF